MNATAGLADSLLVGSTVITAQSGSVSGSATLTVLVVGGDSGPNVSLRAEIYY
jgi:hypothetical protein